MDRCNDQLCRRNQVCMADENKLLRCHSMDELNVRYLRTIKMHMHGSIRIWNVRQILILNGFNGWVEWEGKPIFNWTKKLKGRLLLVVTYNYKIIVKFVGEDDSFTSISTLASTYTPVDTSMRAHIPSTQTHAHTTARTHTPAGTRTSVATSSTTARTHTPVGTRSSITTSSSIVWIICVCLLVLCCFIILLFYIIRKRNSVRINVLDTDSIISMNSLTSFISETVL